MKIIKQFDSNEFAIAAVYGSRKSSDGPWLWGLGDDGETSDGPWLSWGLGDDGEIYIKGKTQGLNRKEWGMWQHTSFTIPFAEMIKVVRAFERFIPMI